MAELFFYTTPQSRGRIVRWLLEEVGQPYKTELLDYATTMKAPAYLAINPMGKVPSIVHGGSVVTECAAICAYLADAFPAAGLAPAVGDKLRGPYYRWLFYTAGPLEAASSNKAMGFTVPAERAMAMGYGAGLAGVLDVIEAALEGRKHIVGDKFSAADLYLASHLGFGMAFNMIEKRPVFESYVATHQARPAAVRAKALDDALVPPKPAAG